MKLYFSPTFDARTIGDAGGGIKNCHGLSFPCLRANSASWGFSGGPPPGNVDGGE